MKEEIKDNNPKLFSFRGTPSDVTHSTIGLRPKEASSIIAPTENQIQSKHEFVNGYRIDGQL